MEHDVFISYSRKDTDIADQICNALDKVGISYFIDRQGIGGGLEFPDILAEAISNCKIFLFLASKNSYNSKFTKSEIIFAFNKKKSNSLLPYIIDGSDLPPALELTFASINWRTIKDHPISTVLMDDLCNLLGISRKTKKFNTSNRGEADATVGNIGHEYDNLSIAELNKLAMKYYSGDEVPRNFAFALQLWHKAITIKEQSNQLDYNEQIACVLHNIGICYAHGRGVLQDSTEAFRWYKAAAEKGDSDAMVNVGAMLCNGEGVPQNFTEALRWYKAAAEKGDSDAMTRVGLMYYYGDGASQNYSEALRWYKAAAEKGNSSAMYYLGAMYDNGEGTSRNYTEALRWYKAAAEKGNSSAMISLGDMFSSGTGVLRNYTESRKWYQAAADNGSGSAMYLLGMYYQYGTKGFYKDTLKAIKLYKAAAEKGDTSAMFSLGCMYENGSDVTKDVPTAMYWFKMASDNGSESALDAYNRLCEAGYHHYSES